MSEDSLPLIRRARDGDAQAVESLLERHLPGLQGFLHQRAGEMLRGKEGISDLVQSTCRELLQDLDELAWEGETHFKRWLYQAALRKVVDKARYWKAERRDAGRDAELAPADGDESMASRIAAAFADELGTPSGAAEHKEELQRLESALQRLSRDHRDVILMARFLDQSHAEIAGQLGRSEGAVRVLLHRAIAALRVEMEKPGKAT